MNKPIAAKDVIPAKVTTGPLPGSRKVYSSPDGRADVKVPFREIALSDGTSFRTYDTSGPYTDASARIDVNRGLEPLRAEWIAARRGAQQGERSRIERVFESRSLGFPDVESAARDAVRAGAALGDDHGGGAR